MNGSVAGGVHIVPRRSGRCTRRRRRCFAYTPLLRGFKRVPWTDLVQGGGTTLKTMAPRHDQVALAERLSASSKAQEICITAKTVAPVDKNTKPCF